jgi:hypothetical protein
MARAIARTHYPRNFANCRKSVAVGSKQVPVQLSTMQRFAVLNSIANNQGGKKVA